MEGLELKGSFREQGRSHGEAYRKEIHELAAIRQPLIRNFLKKFDLWQLEKFYTKQVAALAKYPEIFEEFCGVAEGARIGLNDLMVLNNYTDMRDFLELDPNDEGCSVFYFRNKKATVAGQTWDMHGSATPFVRYLKTHHENNLTCTIFTVTGCLSLAGINSHGVGVLINNLHALECSVKGLMWPGLVKLILLKSQNRAEAQKILATHLPASGHNYLIFDRTGAYNIETTGKQLDVIGEVGDKGGYAFHTNHYVGKLKKFENAERKSSTTEHRWKAVEKVFLEKFDDLDYKSAQDELFVRNAAATICIPVQNDKPNASATCGGLIWDAAASKALFFKGLYTEKDHKEFHT
jgi:isopenicillin-N N-acyltransferase-like protein